MKANVKDFGMLITTYDNDSVGKSHLPVYYSIILNNIEDAT